MGAAACVVGVIAAPVVAGAALGAAGFTASGVAAGSAAAAIQSAVYGGSVAAGSLFALAQSAGATGAIGVAATAAIGGGTGVVGAAATYGALSLHVRLNLPFYSHQRDNFTMLYETVHSVHLVFLVAFIWMLRSKTLPADPKVRTILSSIDGNKKYNNYVLLRLFYDLAEFSQQPSTIKRATPSFIASYEVRSPLYGRMNTTTEEPPGKYCCTISFE